MAQSTIRMNPRKSEDKKHADSSKTKNESSKIDNPQTSPVNKNESAHSTTKHHNAPSNEEAHRQKNTDRHDQDNSSRNAVREYHPDKNQKPGFFSTAAQALSSYTSKHGHAVFYGIVGFIIAALILIIGFWQTVLLVVFIALGSFVGRYHDGDKKTRAQVNNLLKRLT